MIVPFLISFLVTSVLTPGVIRQARRQGWVAMPRADRWHSRPTALMGGISIFLGTITGWLLGHDWASVAPLMVPAAGLFILGIIDDRVRELRPHHRLVGQVAAGAALVGAGVTFQWLPAWGAVPLTLFWVIGITNAVNLLDNMDGLASGVCCISAFALAACSWREGGFATARAAVALAGGCAGFLIYNFNPAQVFMGDCGSMFLGFSLAALAIQGTHRTAPGLALSLLVPVSVLAIPIFDTTLVSVARTLHGRPVSQGFRDHTSHRLVSLGLSERATVLVLYALSALFAVLPLLAARVPVLAVTLIAVLMLIGLSILGLYLGFLKVYPEDSQVPPGARLLGVNLWYKKQLLQVLMDLVLIPLAFVSAFLLRYEGVLPPAVAQGLLLALPLALAGKLCGLMLCGAYRGVWRCAGPADALAAIAGSGLGSVLTALLVAAMPAGRPLSRAALVIDGLLFTTLAVGVRLGYVLLRELFGMVPLRDAPRVIILGAGPEALALIRQLRDPLSSRRAQVCGILDNDPGKQRRRLNGVAVLGPLSALPDLVAAKQLSGCLLGFSPHSPEGQAIMELCRAARIPLYGDVQALPAPGEGGPVHARAA